MDQPTDEDNMMTAPDFETPLKEQLADFKEMEAMASESDEVEDDEELLQEDDADLLESPEPHAFEDSIKHDVTKEVIPPIEHAFSLLFVDHLLPS